MKFITITLTKIIAALLRLLGRGGSLPGQIALKLNSNILKKLTYVCPVIVVTGTNGKTSTSNLITDMFTNSSNKVLSNRKGDNMSYGIATLLLSNASLGGAIKADAIILEVDELNMPFVMKNVRVSDVVVTNFFRDQLDRAMEMNYVITRVEESIKEFNGNLVLNGNDPNVLRLAYKSPNATIYTYGIDELETSKHVSLEANEGKFCPRCDHELVYDYYHYSHIGKFHCSNCDFQTPITTLNASSFHNEDHTFVCEGVTYPTPSQGIYTVYNCMAVISVGRLHEVAVEAIQQTFSKQTRPAGRNEEFKVGENVWIMNLIKNPTGANEVLKVIEEDKREVAVCIVLNDNAQDGRDVSWIYDTMFEKIVSEHVTHIICSGTRAYDMALRLKYANIDMNKVDIIDDLDKSCEKLHKLNMRSYVVTTYTALVPTRKRIERYTK